MEEEEEEKKEEVSFFFHTVLYTDLLYKCGGHVSLHHLILCGLDCFLPHLQPTQQGPFVQLSLAAAGQENSIQGISGLIIAWGEGGE